MRPPSPAARVSTRLSSVWRARPPSPRTSGTERASSGSRSRSPVLKRLGDPERYPCTRQRAREAMGGLRRAVASTPLTASHRYMSVASVSNARFGDSLSPARRDPPIAGSARARVLSSVRAEHELHSRPPAQGHQQLSARRACAARRPSATPGPCRAGERRRASRRCRARGCDRSRRRALRGRAR